MMRLVFRVDGDTTIGTGHVMRCLALAQVWTDAGGKATFLLNTESPALEARLAAEGIEIGRVLAEPGSAADAAETVAQAKRVEAEWAVIDGYHFDADYQRRIKEAGLRVLFIDDYGHAGHYFAYIVLNQNIYADAELYENKESYTRLLLGTKYALLRREFLLSDRRRKISEKARKVLVTLGGGDPDNITSKIIEALRLTKIDDLEAVVVIGGANPHLIAIESAAGRSPFPIKIEQNVADMPRLMAWADAAISGGGTTCWELAFMGLPFATVILAENQRRSAENLAEKKVAVNLGWYEDIKPDMAAEAIAKLLADRALRQSMSNQGKTLIDGQGAQRVAKLLLPAKKVKLRKAEPGDSRLLWEWANDPEVRERSFISDQISWDEHVIWFSRKLRDPNCVQFIVLDARDNPVGQVRFDQLRDNEAEISVSIDKTKRGLGYGGLIIRQATEEIFRITHYVAVHAFIKPENDQSVRSFEKAKFKEAGKEVVKNHFALHYVLSRKDKETAGSVAV